MAVELVVAELVEASKHRNDHRKKLTKPDGFDRLSHRELPISEN